MKINGTIFSKPQQDQLKRGIGAELGKIATKVDDVDKRMLNYMGDWATGNEYHENDVVTWGTDGHLYEVIKAHTSSATFDPDNPEYYKAMTATKYISHAYTSANAFYSAFEQKGASIEYIEVYISGNPEPYIFGKPEQNSNLAFGRLTLYSNDGKTREELVHVYQNSWSFIFNDVDLNGAKTKGTFSITKIIAYTL